MENSRKALIVVSYGTSVPQAECAIEYVEDAIKERFCDRDFFRAYTSKIICRKLQGRGIDICTVTEILEKIKRMGYQDILIQPTHIIPGIDHDKFCKDVNEISEGFESVKIGKPLITRTEDINAVAAAVLKKWTPERGILVLMGHGTDHQNNMIYPALQRAFEAITPKKVFLGTVQGQPDITDVLNMLKECSVQDIHTVTLAPFMLVAGDHALNDMAGDGEKSWKNILIKEGYRVNCIMEGLGMLEDIQKMYAVKAEQACDSIF